MAEKRKLLIPRKEFGRTGYRVGTLGFGAMRLPTRKDGHVDFDRAARLIRYAINHGVNFLDTHHFYHQGESEEAVGRAIAGMGRKNLVLQTKIGMYNNYTEKQFWQLLENALKKLRTSYLDFYLTHSLSWKHYESFNRLFLKVTDKAMALNLIKYRGFSSHDTPENVKKFVESGYFSTMTIQYNLINRQYQSVIELAWEKGMGVVVMGPIGGGLLASPEPEFLKLLPSGQTDPAVLALRFVLSDKHVHVACSGMSTLKQVKQNIATATINEPLTAKEISQMDALIKQRRKLLNLPCTGCGYCLPCPHQVKIPYLFRQYNLARVFGIEKKARKAYLRLKAEEKASSCTGCRQCEKKCPQKIPISRRLQELRDYFEK